MDSSSSTNRRSTARATDRHPTSFHVLTLGEGDFSFSYDLARFLMSSSFTTSFPFHREYPNGPPSYASAAPTTATLPTTTASLTEVSSSSRSDGTGEPTSTVVVAHPTSTARTNATAFQEKASISSTRNDQPGTISADVIIHLTATGLDAATQVAEKYRDSSFLLGQLRALHGMTYEGTETTHARKNRQTEEVAQETCAATAPQPNSRFQKGRRRRLEVEVLHGVHALLSCTPNDWEGRNNSHKATNNEERPPKMIHNRVDTPLSSGYIESSDAVGVKNGKKFDCVIFNHPHLGVEDAVLHASFLAHLLYSVQTLWFRTQVTTLDSDEKELSCVFYLTLATGQWERWKGPATINRLGWTLRDRRPFQPPRISTTFKNSHNGAASQSYYQRRRHQTGKSFAKRTDANSETFTLTPPSLQISSSSPASAETATRNPNEVAAVPESIPQRCDDCPQSWHPFWFDLSGEDEHCSRNNTTVSIADSFDCPHCGKSFREERSRKNHVRNKHAKSTGNEESNKKPKQASPDDMQSDWICTQCSPRRSFISYQALRDHTRAKHEALHKAISPDWHDRWTEDSGTLITNKTYMKCSICQQQISSMQEHMQQFTPTDIVLTTCNSVGVASPAFRCSFCQKLFREKRAQLQHENFCATRLNQQSSL